MSEVINKPISREERRRRERVNEEAQNAIRDLTNQFLTFFMESENPEGQEVVDKMKQISAKWRVFCKNKGLIPAAYKVLDMNMAQIVQDYYKEKETKPETNEATAEV